MVNRLLYCKFLPLRLGICRRWSSSWILASQSTRSAPLAFPEGPGLPLLPPAFLPTESLAFRLLLGVGIDWLQRCSATAATRDCISADAVRPPRATVLLVLVTYATREDIPRLLKGARLPSSKPPVLTSNNTPPEGQQQACDRRRQSGSWAKTSKVYVYFNLRASSRPGRLPLVRHADARK